MLKKIILLFMCVYIGLLFCSCNINRNKSENEITILLDWTPNTNHTGIFAAQYLGYFKDEGLTVKIEQPPQESSTALVAAGKVEFAIAFQDFLAPALVADNPLPIQAIAAIAQHNTCGILCRKSANIKSPKDISFKNYSTFDNQVELSILKYCIESDGGDFNNVNLIHAHLDNIAAAFSTNIDAAFGYFGIENIIAKHFNIDTDFLFFRNINPALDYYTPVLITNINYINNSPDTIRKVLRALSRGYTFSANYPQAAADILIKCIPELNHEIILESQKYMSLQYINDAPKWGIIDGIRWNNFFDWLYENKIINKSIAHDSSFTNAFLS